MYWNRFDLICRRMVVILDLVEITDDLVVKVKLVGACGSCPMRTMTLRAGVEGTLKKEVPEVKSVEAV